MPTISQLVGRTPLAIGQKRTHSRVSAALLSLATLLSLVNISFTRCSHVAGYSAQAINAPEHEIRTRQIQKWMVA
jgi:hypothetical protein